MALLLAPDALPKVLELPNTVSRCARERALCSPRGKCGLRCQTMALITPD